ncbi:MAG: hypothetical protein ACI9H8_001774 [Lysobacterales bacterium]|jgi:hypothetical protein
MTRYSLIRIPTTLVLLALLTACTGTKVVHQWQNPQGEGVAAEKLAVVAMAPEEGMRQAVEKVLVDQINSAGGNAFSSFSLKGMRSNLTREKAEAALKEAGADAVVVAFITGATKGEKLQRADYYLRYEGNYTYTDWMSPQFVDVYSIQEGSGYYEQERSLFLETSYYQLPSASQRWTIITESSGLEYRAVAAALAGKITAEMKKDGAL